MLVRQGWPWTVMHGHPHFLVVNCGGSPSIGFSNRMPGKTKGHSKKHRTPRTGCRISSQLRGCSHHACGRSCVNCVCLAVTQHNFFTICMTNALLVKIYVAFVKNMGGLRGNYSNKSMDVNYFLASLSCKDRDQADCRQCLAFIDTTNSLSVYLPPGRLTRRIYLFYN